MHSDERAVISPGDELPFGFRPHAWWWYALVILVAAVLWALQLKMTLMVHVMVTAGYWWKRRAATRLHVAVSRDGMRFLGGRFVPWSSITLAERRGRWRFRYVRMETTQPDGSVSLNHGMVADLKGLRHAVATHAGQDHAVTRALLTDA
jgi:hypothetical protein